jgi:hypothetical protein
MDAACGNPKPSRIMPRTAMLSPVKYGHAGDQLDIFT